MGLLRKGQKLVFGELEVAVRSVVARTPFKTIRWALLNPAIQPLFQVSTTSLKFQDRSGFSHS